MREPKYNIGDKIYHVTSESPVGIILDIKYMYLSRLYEYWVSFAFDNGVWCMEHEISLNKTWE